MKLLTTCVEQENLTARPAIHPQKSNYYNQTVPPQLTIKSIRLQNPFILAPLAGYTDLPFRLLCRRYGAALCYTEMISCHGIVYRKEKTLQMAKSVPDERPVALQLFGADPAMMGEAAAAASELAIDIIDINMGCPVKKVVKKGAGAALMKNPDLAASIIRQVCKNTTLPVTVKIRIGWNHETVVAPDFAKMTEDCGVSGIAVHGRTWAQGFGGKVDRQTIARVKQSVSIPVIGNGDITSYAEALEFLEMTGCDGVMIGRGALGNPWVFRPEGSPSSLSRRLKCLAEHLDLIQQYSNPDKILARIKNHAGRYFKGIAGGSAIRRQIYSTKDFHELAALAQGSELP